MFDWKVKMRFIDAYEYEIDTLKVNETFYDINEKGILIVDFLTILSRIVFVGRLRFYKEEVLHSLFFKHSLFHSLFNPMHRFCLVHVQFY